MKKLFIIITALLFIGCSKSEDEPVVHTFPSFYFFASSEGWQGMGYDLKQGLYNLVCERLSGTSTNPTRFKLKAQENDSLQGISLVFDTNGPLTTKTYNVTEGELRLGNRMSLNNIEVFSITITKVRDSKCSGTFDGVMIEGMPANKLTTKYIIKRGVFENIPILN